MGIFVDASKPAVEEIFDEALAPETRQAAQESSFDRREVAKGMRGRVPPSGLNHFLVKGRVSTQVAYRPDDGGDVKVGLPRGGVEPLAEDFELFRRVLFQRFLEAGHEKPFDLDFNHRGEDRVREASERQRVDRGIARSWGAPVS